MTTREMTLEERLDFIEFRQELLFENSEKSRLLFESDVTRDEYQAIVDVFSEFSRKIDSGEKVFHSSYEQSIYQAVPHHKGNYHFAENLALTNYEQGSWKEVFETLYGEMEKFKSDLKKND
ncbi:DUF1878 domain-containing protein [Ureibacillus aquaedulcis]|uniref:DUF1878 domain-containing protein n=1 Tax=Ureibacillus aquaedulcis TaxID=3058421 RepID=A0ABT8GN88_9BACL|nr:DUF1878 domain-containing protein [Ureibacillus sp. BA0131]MDN4492877.1 DUF1878 domain-containing protein [Ureibacillus sp. BA0131]